MPERPVMLSQGDTVTVLPAAEGIEPLATLDVMLLSRAGWRSALDLPILAPRFI